MTTYTINPTVELEKTIRRAKKDIEFKNCIIDADPDTKCLFKHFLSNADKVVLAGYYHGYILGKYGKEEYQKL